MRAISESAILLVPGERVSDQTGLSLSASTAKYEPHRRADGRSSGPLLVDEGARRRSREVRLPLEVGEHLPEERELRRADDQLVPDGLGRARVEDEVVVDADHEVHGEQGTRTPPDEASASRRARLPGTVPVMGWTGWRKIAERSRWFDDEIDHDGPACYELGLGGPLGGDMRIVYVGETVNEKSRVIAYASHGSHLARIIRSALRDGWSLFYRAQARP